MGRCRLKTASAQSTFWHTRRNEKETTGGTRGAVKRPHQRHETHENQDTAQCNEKGEQVSAIEYKTMHLKCT